MAQPSSRLAEFEPGAPFIVLRGFRRDGEDLAPGSLFDKARVPVRRLRALYDQRHIGYPPDYTPQPPRDRTRSNQRQMGDVVPLRGTKDLDGKPAFAKPLPTDGTPAQFALGPGDFLPTGWDEPKPDASQEANAGAQAGDVAQGDEGATTPAGEAALAAATPTVRPYAVKPKGKGKWVIFTTLDGKQAEGPFASKDEADARLAELNAAPPASE